LGHCGIAPSAVFVAIEDPWQPRLYFWTFFPARGGFGQAVLKPLYSHASIRSCPNSLSNAKFPELES
jgi:hypothetical protein